MITFNSVSSTAYTDILSVMRVSRPLYPGARQQTIDIPGRDGVYYFGKDARAAQVSFRLSLKSTSAIGRRAAIRQIAGWLDTDDVAILKVTDEPDLRYYAVLTEPVNVEEFADLGMTDVTFMIPDGCAYSDTASAVGPQQEIQTLFLGGATDGYYFLGIPDNKYWTWNDYEGFRWYDLDIYEGFQGDVLGLVRESVAYDSDGTLVAASIPVYEDV